MSEIQILLPLSVLQGAESLTPEGIAEHLSNAVKLKDEADQLRTAYNEVVAVLNAAGGSLEHIINEVSGFEQARAIRGFIAELKAARRLQR